MVDAVDRSGLEEPDRSELVDYLAMAARSLVNARG